MNSLHTSVFLLYIFYSYGQELPDTVIVHYHEPLTWSKAGNFCLEHGGVLESNITEVRGMLISTNYIGSVWLGIYETLTPWAIIWGCYLINGGMDQFTVRDTEQWKCQQICSYTEYFSVKDTRCFCLNENQLISKGECNDECRNETGCLKVLRSYSDTLKKHEREKNENTAEEDLRCISARCIGDQLIRRSDTCDNTYSVDCDNGQQFNYVYDSQIEAERKCESLDSFIKWYPDDHCNLTTDSFKSDHYTNARREVKQVILKRTDSIPTALRCYELYHNPPSTELRNETCDKTLSYVCRFQLNGNHTIPEINTTVKTVVHESSSIERNGNHTIPEINTTVKNVVHESSSIAGIVAGSIFGLAALVLAVAVLIFIYKRRFNQMENKTPHVRNPQRKSSSLASEMQKTAIRETAVYTEINDDQLHKESRKNAYSFASPIYGKSLTQENENVTEHAYTQISEEQFNNETAKRLDIFVKSNPMLPDANDNLQVKTTKNRLLDDQAKSDTFGRQNINFKINELHDEHFQQLKSSAVNPVQNTNYSLAKPVRESGEIDPYSDNQDYDKLNSLKKKGGDTQFKVYDHLPTTVEADPTYDHTVINSPKVHDNNYDHFTFDDENI